MLTGASTLVIGQASLAPAAAGTAWDVQLQPGDAGALSTLLPAIAADGATIGATPVPGLYVVQGPAAAMGALGQALAASPGVAYAGPEHILSDAAAPNDPNYVNGSQWQLNGTWGINAPAAWNVTIGSDRRDRRRHRHGLELQPRRHGEQRLAQPGRDPRVRACPT